MTQENDLVLGASIGGRTAGIRLLEDDILVFGALDAGCGLVLEDGEPASCRVGGRTVVGGLMPDGATRAVAIDATGRGYDGTVHGGVYVIDAGKHGLWHDLVRFEDERGTLVPRRLPAGRRLPVSDALEPCPLCTDTAWVMIEQDVHCSTCGLFVGEADPEADDEHEGPEMPGDEHDGPEMPGDEPASLAGFLASLPFALYCGGPVTGGGFVSVGGGSPEEVTVQSDRLHVASSVRPLRDLRWQLSMALREPDPPLERSAAARRVFEDHQERAAHGAVAGAGDIQARTFVVDNRPLRFSFLAVEDAWAAAGSCDGVFITAWARELDPDAVTFQRLQPSP